MNIEFLLLIVDYFRTVKRRDFVLEWLCAFLIGLLVYWLNRNNINISDLLKNISSNAVALLGVLIGFSVAVITLLVTTNSKNIDEIKAHRTKYKLGSRHITLFDLLLINYTYSVVAEIIIVILNLILPGLCSFELSNNTLNLLNALNIFLVCHVLLLTIRNMTNFYFILIKK